MSDEVYDADGDISRYLLSPSPEAHVLAAVPHVGVPEHHVPPPVQGGAMALPPAAPTPPLNDLPVALFGNDDVQNHHAMAMDVQPSLQGQYGLPADGLDDLLGTLSLDDHYTMDHDAAGNNGSSAVAAEHSVFPAEEGIFFVPFVPGQLDCSNCRSAGEVLQASANHKLYFIVHVVDPAGTFQHAILDRAYIDSSGQIILNELMYADLRERTHGCVQNFIANCVEVLKKDTSGQLTDSGSTTTSQANNGMHYQLEMDMLKEILSAPSSNTQAAGVPQSGPEAAPQQAVTRAEENTNNVDHDAVLHNAANWPAFSPAILESSQVIAQDGIRMPLSSTDASAATDFESQLAKQRRRIAQLTMNDIARLMHKSKKDAAKELKISVTTLKRLCRKNNTDRWPARKINSLDSKIKNMEQAALRNVGMNGLLAIKEKIEKLKYEKAQVHASVLKVIQENQKNNDFAGGSSSG